ncbi:unnamed protein product [Urochloa decumbens]|uniref:F-box domain-containing protein n=1 Tax=Urochloa decumbens TaxID=240449 RepID=A0ABC8XF76_9POAL
MSSSLPRAAEPCPDGWLSLSPAGSNDNRRLKRTPLPRVEDAGTPLGDEILLQVFAGLVCCAATCRRWRRLVSGDAEFICRLMRPSYFRHLAAGFFHRSSHDAEADAPPRFFPFDPSSSSSSRRASICKNAAAAVLAGDVFKGRCHFSACRSYSSDTKAWGAEGKTSGARIGGARLGEMDAGVAARGAAFWLHGDMVFSLRADTLEAAVEAIPNRNKRARELCLCLGGAAAGQNRRLAVSPDGRLFAVQVGRGSLNRFVISVFRRDDDDEERVVGTKRRWTKAEDVTSTRICHGGDVYGPQGARQQEDLALYALDLEAREVREVPAPESRCSVRKSSWSFYGYEMDMVSHLSSHAERDSLM